MTLNRCALGLNNALEHPVSFHAATHMSSSSCVKGFVCQDQF